MKVGGITIVERADTPSDRFFYLPNAETWIVYDEIGEHRVLPDITGPVVVCGLGMSEEAKEWILSHS